MRLVDARERVRARFAAHRRVEWPALPGRTNHLRAGVLVPIAWGERPQVLAIVRSSALRQHRGEVGFPGGKPEQQDADLVATALREAREEVGLSGVEVWGQLSSVPLYTSDFRLEPTVGRIEPDQVCADPGEVAEVLWLDVIDWLERSEWEGVPFDMVGVEHLSPVFEVGPHLMYGGTAYVFLETLGVLSEVLGMPLPPMTGRRFSPEDVIQRALRSVG